MSQWQSQTRKLNNHYQSTGRKLSGWTFGSKLHLCGVYYTDGTFGLFPQDMREPGAALFEAHTTGGTYWQQMGGITPPAGECNNSYHYTAGENDVYVGVYTSEEFEVTYSSIASGSWPTNTESRLQKMTKDGDTLKVSGDYVTFTKDDWNGQTALVPTIKRTALFYYAKPQTTELPEAVAAILGTPEEAGELSGSTYLISSENTFLNMPSDVLNVLDAHIPAWNMPRLPGVCAVVPLQTGTGHRWGSYDSNIWGCDFRDSLSSGTYAAASAYVSGVTTSGGYALRPDEPARGLAFSGGRYLYTTDDGSDIMRTGPGWAAVACQGNSMSFSGWNAVYPWTPVQYGDYYGCFTFCRQCTGIREEKNFTFWTE